jgi:hypothetical protein
LHPDLSFLPQLNSVVYNQAEFCSLQSFGSDKTACILASSLLIVIHHPFSAPGGLLSYKYELGMKITARTDPNLIYWCNVACLDACWQADSRMDLPMQ